MKLIVDTNILFSAVLKPTSPIAALLLQTGEHEFLGPSFLREEINLKQEKISRLSGLSLNEVKFISSYFLQQIRLVNLNAIDVSLYKQAYLMVKDIGQNDFAFVALAMHIPQSKLLTGDKRLI